MRPSLLANCEQLMGMSATSMKWIFSSTFLPHTGEPKDFQLEEGRPLEVFLARALHAALWSNAQP